MANQTGVAIYIKAFLPTGKTLDEQFEALSLIKEAKTTGKFDAVLAQAIDVEVRTESKTRRIEEAPATTTVVLTEPVVTEAIEQPMSEVMTTDEATALKPEAQQPAQEPATAAGRSRKAA